MVKSVCGYCGVGCSLEIDLQHKTIKGDKNYPINQGSLCLKGTSSCEIVRAENRLLTPQIKVGDKFETTSWDNAIELIVSKIKSSKPEKIGFYLSGQLLTEDYYIANKLGKGFIGTNNVDTNSRACMASAVMAYKKSIGADFVPVRMEDIFKANLLILAGANTAESHVVFHSKIKKAKKKGLKVVVIDPRFTETVKIANIHIPINVGRDIEFFNLLSKKIIEENIYDKEFVKNKVNNFELLKNGVCRLDEDELLAKIGISKELFNKFWKLYKNSQNIITAWTMGLNQSSQGTHKNLALLNTHLLTGKIFKAGNGPLSLTGQPNAMGGREVGGLATMLAVWLGFDEEAIKKVSKFWKTDNISKKPGIVATKMLQNNLDVLIICHTDPVYHLPNRNKVEQLIKKIPFVVEINAYKNSETSKFAHLQLPASPWGEKEGTQTNLDRTISKQKKLYPSLGQSKADWEIFQLIAQKLGFKEAFDFKTAEEIFNEYKQMTKLNGFMDIYKVDYKKLDGEPFVWGKDIKDFLTPDKKGNLFFVENNELSEKATKEYPFVLLTGRTRDQWHSGTKTTTPKSLLKYKKLIFCEVSLVDANKLGLNNEDEIKIISKRGAIKSKVVINDKLKEWYLFLPLSQKDLNYITNDLLDEISFEPDYNHNAVRIEPMLI